MKKFIKNVVTALVERRRASRKRRAMTHGLNVVTYIEDDGDYIYARFMRKNGEVVIGIYDRVGWQKAPKTEREIGARTGSPPVLPMVDRSVATDERNIVTAIENDGEDINAQVV